ncbi:MAG: preprotein translocase subunit YajC [Firmicutes bacterium]|nr:preprotein translocase subunit YajC [Bacillota bacterium]
MLVMIFGLMYFMVLRPQQKKDKETQKMRESLRVGDEIVSIGGFYGKIIKVKEDSIVMVCGADKTKLELAKWGISQVINPSSAPVEKEKEADKEEENKKPSPRSIKKLGADKTEASESAQKEEKSEE